jgi:hypothetical protein
MKAEGFPMKNFKGSIEVLQALLLGFLYPDRVKHYCCNLVVMISFVAVCQNVQL